MIAPVNRLKLASLRKIVTVSAAALLTACATDKFNGADADQTGGISPKEFDAYMKETVFSGIDSNGDGVITMAEWRIVAPDHPSSKFKQVDANGDGSISRVEADKAADKSGHYKQLFRKIDTDGNGSLSRAEIDAFKATMAKQPGATDLDKLSNAANS